MVEKMVQFIKTIDQYPHQQMLLVASVTFFCHIEIVDGFGDKLGCF